MSRATRQARRAARAAKRAARRDAANTLLPPEGVPLKLEIAGVGVRMGAQIADILITFLAMLAIMILLSVLDVTTVRTQGAIGALLFFLIRVPYYILAELAWNGQTLGKKLLKIKVVAHDGGPLTTHALVLRNLMKEAEVFLPITLLLTLDREAPIGSLLAVGWISACLAVPLFNRYRRRLGDLMAGTHVIHLPSPSLLTDLATSTRLTREAREKFTFLTHQLDHYGAFELQTLEALLRAQDAPSSRSDARARERTIAAVVERIRKKIGYADAVSAADRLGFLRAFYNAQRRHLEQRQLFGDRRSDKFHAEKEPQS